MDLTPQSSKANFRYFLWHSAFLALTTNFMDIDTVIPSLLIKAGGSAVHLGFLTAIMVGGASLFQLVFAGYLSNKTHKKKHLLIGINLRVLALLSLAFLLYSASRLPGLFIILAIFFFISIFSLSGSFANVSYLDILGKSINEQKRKKFFSSKQVINSIGVFASALIVREMLRYFDYPINYSFLFLCAGLLLLVASLGFWKIREPVSIVKSKQSLVQFLKVIPSEIKKNNNLKYYLLTINTLGMGISLLPFMILYAKENFGLSFELIGNFLLFRTLGMLFAGLFLYRFSKRFIYKQLLFLSLLLAGAIPVLGLIFSDNSFIYQLIFIFSGIFVATYKISISGVLLEISTNENRATYAGISGAGNILSTIFPLFAGVLISYIGYTFVFLGVTLIVLLSYTFVVKLNCTPVTD
jgi:MFS family permease